MAPRRRYEMLGGTYTNLLYSGQEREGRNILSQLMPASMFKS